VIRKGLTAPAHWGCSATNYVTVDIKQCESFASAFGDEEARMADQISPQQFHESQGVGDWRVLGDGASAYFRTGSFAAGARLVQAISALPGIDDHPPDVDVRQDGVTVRLITITDDYCGMSQRDVDVARQISGVARELGLATDPLAVQSLLVIPGATDTAAVLPFWRAVLGYEPRPDSPEEDLIDPRSRGASFWFERMEQPRPDGGGAIHVAIWVPYEQAEARIAAALAAGGRMVRDEFAPAWWTLADAAGNEADIATTMGRD
jgi:4a-hydroxytetrahydrobiopterin dehydratase